jgi:5'-deoxynucleotidase YfbR-like HD superfamily hydrolase
MDHDHYVRIDTRLAGYVERYHTWIKHRRQTIAEHSWNLCRIYFSVVENPDPKFIFHLVFHDIGENVTGDAPYPVKRDNPKLKEILDMLEHRSYATQLDFWGAFQFISAAEIDKTLFKQLELIEMAEYGMDELCFGNSHGFIIADRCLQALYNQDACVRLIDYVIQRLSLFFKQYMCDTVYQDWWNVSKWQDKLDE